MRRGKLKTRKRSSRSRRDGAILLDLFLATLIFAVCVIAIGQFGSQSLQVARATAIERVAALKAESVLAKEIAHGLHKSPKVWKEMLQGIPLTIHATWTETDQFRLQRLTVDIAADTDLKVGRNTASLSRLVLVSEGK
jgi:hypothetical protein